MRSPRGAELCTAGSVCLKPPRRRDERSLRGVLVGRIVPGVFARFGALCPNFPCLAANATGRKRRPSSRARGPKGTGLRKVAEGEEYADLVPAIRTDHFEEAMARARKSVSTEDLRAAESARARNTYRSELVHLAIL